MAIELGATFNPTQGTSYKDYIYIELANTQRFEENLSYTDYFIQENKNKYFFVNPNGIEYGIVFEIQNKGEYFFPAVGGIIYADRLLEYLNGYFVTAQPGKGFENGLLVGMMLANSGIM